MGYDSNKRSIIKYAVIILLAGVIFSSCGQSGGTTRAVAGIADPVQEPAEGKTKMEIGGYDVDINYLYSYDISALVVSAKDYSDHDLEGKLVPKDLALAWGKVAEYNDRINFHWRQSGRWYYWKVNTYEEISHVGGPDGVACNSANNHLIPADDSVRNSIEKVKKGDYIRIKGYLVNVDARNDKGDTFFWNSSTTREDTGDGACEVIYVTGLEWLDQ